MLHCAEEGGYFSRSSTATHSPTTGQFAPQCSSPDGPSASNTHSTPRHPSDGTQPVLFHQVKELGPLSATRN